MGAHVAINTEKKRGAGKLLCTDGTMTDIITVNVSVLR